MVSTYQQSSSSLQEQNWNENVTVLWSVGVLTVLTKYVNLDVKAINWQGNIINLINCVRMDYILLIIFCILTPMHFYVLQICFYILSTNGLTRLNTVHCVVIFSTIFPFVIGDLIIITSIITNGVPNASFIVEMVDFCGILTFHSIFVHTYQYRSSLLYKGVANRFYEFVYNFLVRKALINPVACIVGLVTSYAWNYSTTSFLIIYQICVAAWTAMMYLSSKYKFESLNILQSQRSNVTESVVAIKIFRSRSRPDIESNKQISKNSWREKYEETKRDLYNNLRRALISMSFFIALSITLLAIFRKKSSFDQYYLSISYRLVCVIPMIIYSRPIIKSCEEKRNKTNVAYQSNIDDEEDNIYDI